MPALPEGSPAPVASRFDRALKSSIGSLILRPWFDQAALRLLIDWYFPLSRAWAVAADSGGSFERFVASVPRRRRTDRFVPRILKMVEDRRLVLDRAEARWEEAFFGSGPATAEVEAERLRAASAWMASRRLFVPLHLEKAFPPVQWCVEDAVTVQRRHGPRLTAPHAAFQPRTAGPIAVETSRGYLSPDGITGWLRYPCPVPTMGERAWARVVSPSLTVERETDTRRSRPTFIFAHGVGMEHEFWSGARDPLAGLASLGIRTIRPEAPWHGRRRLAGAYGGEPIFARGVGGLLDFFHASVLEIGQLIAWARATRKGPVVVGGVSLGALTTQLVAVAARDWPEEMRPDALFMVAPSLSLAEVAFEGSLSRGLGVPQALARAGWSRAATNAWLPLLGWGRAPAIAPDRMIVMLGEADDVTLAAGGERLVAAWQVPADNVFRCESGHFSVSLGLGRDHAPLARLVSLLQRI